MVKISLLSLLLLMSSFNTPFGSEEAESTSKGKVERMSSSINPVDLILSHKDGNQPLPNPDVLAMGVKGYLKLLEEGEIQLGKPLTIVDFSLPSTEKRIWVIDMEEGKILHHDLVAHGRNSGNLMAQNFSNVNSSFMSSLGFYLTGETYHGKHGFSLRLDGLEADFNSNARDRAIVIHGADYAEEAFAKQTGRLGRSLGCPALPNKTAPLVIDLIKEKSCVFIYGNNSEYLSLSNFLNS